ncbi:hypothetical protein Taro_019161 [Colocasia esculenta]|uniref:Uncharacterized protein n=1 Tax=Colocasia esculenta TaxID=4460 RepID=A0A843UYD9_COLES|nr:hypothetical protein [Colocasia esculenta]
MFLIYREFDSVILQQNPRLTDVQVEKEREKYFPTWLRSRVEQDRSDARELAASTQFSVDDINEPICLYMDNEQEEVDPSALEVESDEEEESPDDEDEFKEDDEDDRYGTWRTEWEGFHLHRPRVHLVVHARDCLPVYADDRDCLPVYVGYRDRLPDHASSATFPFFLTTRGKIDPGSASCYITTLVHAHIPGPVDAWREFPVPVRDLLYDMFMRRYMFMRPVDLPRARAVWESTA